MALRFEEVKTLLLTHRLQSPQNCMYSCWQILLHLLFPRNDRQRIRQERHEFWGIQAKETQKHSNIST